jgi:putative peptidoglycan lipid II flippase
VFPRLAEQVADGDLDALNATISRSLRTIMFLTIPATLGLILLRHPATVTLLQHGEYTAADSAITAAALGWYCLGIIPQAGIEIHSRGFYALGDTKTPVILAVVAVGLNLVLSASLFGPFEHEGLAFAVSAASWLEWALMYVLYSRRTGQDPIQDLHTLALFAVCGALMSLGLALALGQLDGSSRFDALLQAAAGSLIGALLYLAFALALRVPDIAEYLERVRGRVARARPGRS